MVFHGEVDLVVRSGLGPPNVLSLSCEPAPHGDGEKRHAACPILMPVRERRAAVRSRRARRFSAGQPYAGSPAPVKSWAAPALASIMVSKQDLLCH